MEGCFHENEESVRIMGKQRVEGRGQRVEVRFKGKKEIERRTLTSVEGR